MFPPALQLLDRVRGRLRRSSSRRLARRDLCFHLSRPIISFTFDDFPQSAAQVGARILSEYGAKATYYLSFGLIGQQGPTGKIADRADVAHILSGGHELGCHTFGHENAWFTTPREFARSLDANQDAVARLFSGTRLLTMSYPLSEPHPGNKMQAGRRFAGCRAGGQTNNAKVVDLNCMRSFFLEQAHGDFSLVKQLIDQNRRDNGWLIFSTHDIAERPTPYGCTPEFFRAAVQASLHSGAAVMPVAAALRHLRLRPGVA
jgi:peptidoglycan/xylan/chitin deacetylase (PgdA/CDA1 family)